MCSNYMQLQIGDKSGACRAINQGTQTRSWVHVLVIKFDYLNQLCSARAKTQNLHPEGGAQGQSLGSPAINHFLSQC
jgi:hypothetical protein